MPQPYRSPLEDDLPWLGNGVVLAERMRALAERLDREGDTGSARDIRDVLTCEYDPVSQSRRPSLGNLEV